MPLPGGVGVAVADYHAAHTLSRGCIVVGVALPVLCDDPLVGYEVAQAIVDVVAPRASVTAPTLFMLS